MNKNEQKREPENDQQEDLPTMPTEAGDFGDEQCPAGIKNTDKKEWTYSADKTEKTICKKK